MRILPSNSAEWDRCLEGTRHDFYHTRAYHQVAEASGEGQAFLAVTGGGDQYIAWPYLLRNVADRANDVTSVYGYAGPVWPAHFEPSADFWNCAQEGLAEAWRSQHVVTAFARLHPLLRNQAGLAADRIQFAGQTVSLDTSCGDEERQRDYQRILRQEINAARRKGVVTAVDESWSGLEDFVCLYHRTMRRNRAPDYYSFPRAYFERLREALGGAVHLMLTTCEGQLGAACIFVEYAGTLHAHLEGTNEELLHLSPFKVMIDDASRWARERGNVALHLGGGRGGSADSLFAFKARFSKRRHDFFVAKWVVDYAAYEQLCENRRKEAERANASYQLAEFFPAYRAPLIIQQLEQVQE